MDHEGTADEFEYPKMYLGPTVEGQTNQTDSDPILLMQSNMTNAATFDPLLHHIAAETP